MPLRGRWYCPTHPNTRTLKARNNKLPDLCYVARQAIQLKCFPLFYFISFYYYNFGGPPPPKNVLARCCCVSLGSYHNTALYRARANFIVFLYTRLTGKERYGWGVRKINLVFPRQKGFSLKTKQNPIATHTGGEKIRERGDIVMDKGVSRYEGGSFTGNSIIIINCWNVI